MRTLHGTMQFTNSPLTTHQSSDKKQIHLQHSQLTMERPQNYWRPQNQVTILNSSLLPAFDCGQCKGKGG